jgi:hypothetical protein
LKLTLEQINEVATLTQLRVAVELKIKVNLRKPNVGWVERLFAIPIIGVQMIDGYRKKALHPSYGNMFV